MTAIGQSKPFNASALRLAAFMALVLGVGMTIGYLNVPGQWYATLQKPPFNPPDWLFAPVWTVLFVLISIAGSRTWDRGSLSAATMLWFVQMALNFSWSPVFFSLHMIAAALVIVAGLFVSVLVFVVLQWSRDRTSALLFIPYACWVGFATVLNFSILLLNPIKS